VLWERWLPWKVGLYVLEMISLWGCNFWMDELAYDNKAHPFIFKPWRIGLQVSFTTPCLLLVVFRFVRSISLGIPGSMCSAYYSWVSSLPAVLALRDFKVHVGATYSSNEASNVKTTVNDWPSFETVLQVLDINSYYSQVRFRWSLDNVELGCKNNVIEYMSFFDYSFN